MLAPASAAPHACVVMVLYKVILFIFFVHKKHYRSFITLRLNITWIILTMPLLPFWALNMVVALLSTEGQKALGFHQKYLNLCTEEKWRSYGFGTTWGWVINDRIFIFGLTILLRPKTYSTKYANTHACYLCELNQFWLLLLLQTSS